MSSENTPPLVRNSRSLFIWSIAISSEEHTFCTFFACAGGRSYRFLSTGSPGWILFCTPSSPAISIAENARYGLVVGSGKRTSTRRAFGFDTYGMRQAAERLRAEYARLIGASKPGTSRLYELVPGLVMAFSAFACLITPPM